MEIKKASLYEFRRERWPDTLTLPLQGCRGTPLSSCRKLGTSVPRSRNGLLGNYWVGESVGLHATEKGK